MLITKEVEVVLCNRNIKWFEDKGYEIPRIKKTRYDKNGHNKGSRASVPKGTTIIANSLPIPFASDDGFKLVKTIKVHYHWNIYVYQN